MAGQRHERRGDVRRHVVRIGQDARPERRDGAEPLRARDVDDRGLLALRRAPYGQRRLRPVELRLAERVPLRRRGNDRHDAERAGRGVAHLRRVVAEQGLSAWATLVHSAASPKQARAAA